MTTVRSGTFSEQGTTNAPVVTKPAGAAAGDVCYIFISTEDSATVTMTTRPSGFLVVGGGAEADPTVIDTTGADMRGFCYRKVLDGGEGATFTFGLDASLWVSWCAICTNGADGGVLSTTGRTQASVGGSSSASISAVTLGTDQIGIASGATYEGGPFNSVVNWTEPTGSTRMGVYRTTTDATNEAFDNASGATRWWAITLVLDAAGGAAAAGLTADPLALTEIFIRNRVMDLPVWAGSPGASVPAVEGVAAVSFGGTFTAAGAPNTLGQAVATFGFTATALGHIVERGVAVATYGFTATAFGVDRALGVAVAAFGGTFVAAGVVGTPPVQGQATAAFGGTFTANGVPRTPGAATALYGATFTAAGVPRTPGVAVATFGFTATTLGRPRHIGQAAVSFGGTLTASGVPRTPGAAVATFGYTATALGVAGTPPVQGQATATFGYTATALGVDRSLGVAVATFGYTATSSGHQHRAGTAGATFGYTATAVGRPRVLGAATASFGFTAAIFIITYKLRLVAVGVNRYSATAAAASTATAGTGRYSATTDNRYSGVAGGNRYSVEED